MSKRQHGGRPSKRLHILFHAVELASNYGPKGFTLDNLCEQAQISKGGVLYHFASVPTLIKDMLEFYITNQLPLWVEQGILDIASPNLDARAFTIDELITVVEHAPINPLLERLVFHVLSEQPFALPYQAALKSTLQEAPTTKREKLESALGKRLLRILSVQGADYKSATNEADEAASRDARRRKVRAHDIQLR